ncbi:MAG: DUF4199 domain-containing protein [Bacteroidota bacterium]
MKKIILIIGSIIGVIWSANMLVMVNMMYTDTEFKGNDILGYAAMIMLFSLIYFGVRNYRNKHLEGKISFLQALKIGALIALLASTIYVVISLFYYYLFAPDFIDVYTDYVLKNSPPESLEAKTTEMADLKEMFKNPLLVILITYFEVLPIGLIVALLSAFLVKKK